MQSLNYYIILYDYSEKLGKLRYELEKKFRAVYDKACDFKSGGKISKSDSDFFKNGYDLIIDGLEMMRKSGLTAYTGKDGSNEQK